MSYVRPIRCRYVDPHELVWMATARRLGLSPIRRNPAIFAATDGTGLLELGPKDDLDPDDNAGQQIFHEICHWIINGVDSYHARDWGFPLTDEGDWREYACLRVQAALAERHGLRDMFASTGTFREYWDKIPDDPMAPFDDTEEEARICARAREALVEADGPPWGGHLDAALAATAAMRRAVSPFLADYQCDIPGDVFPSMWGPERLEPGIEQRLEGRSNDVHSPNLRPDVDVDVRAQ